MADPVSETLAALLHSILTPNEDPHPGGDMDPADGGRCTEIAVRLATRGVRVGDEGLRAAVETFLTAWERPGPRRVDIDALRAALAATPTPPSKCGCPCNCHTDEDKPEWPGSCEACCTPEWGPLCECIRGIAMQRLAALAATPNPPEIDVERLARAITQHAADHKRHSRTHVRADCAVAIAAAYKAES